MDKKWKTKKKLKLSTPKTKSCPSNPHFVCNKEAVIELEKLSDSVVAKMTAGGSALPPEQTKKKLKFSTPKTKSCPSNPHFVCNKEAVIELDKLSDSVVAEMTAGGSALPPEQTKKKLKLSTPKTKSCPSNNPHFICNKEAVIEREKLSDSVVAEMTAGGSALPPEQVNESNDDALDINSFPNEIILKVFGYLEKNRLGQVAQVCRRWNMLTKSPILLKRVNFKFSSSHTSQITMVKSSIDRLPPYVTSIKLDFTKSRDLLKPLNFVELCVKLQEKCPRLEELILIDSDISNSLSTVIDLCSYFLQDVKNLVFHHCIFPAAYTAIGEVGGISKIEVLDLSWCILIERLNKPQFSRMPCLKVLCFYETIIDDPWFLNDTSFLNQLHVLDLRWTGINGSTFPVIQNHGHNLKKLYICGIKLQAHDLNFDNSIFPHLKIICLSNTCVTCEVVVSLIQSCPSLQNVYVSEYVAQTFAAHPFVVANRCKSGIVKAIGPIHEHN